MNTFFNIFVIKIRFSSNQNIGEGESNFDDKYVEKSVQLVRGSSFRNDLLQNPCFKLSAQEQEIESIKENGQNKLQVAENQIQSLKEQLLNSSMNTSMSMSFTEKSEAMSTSTVSKVEETARMADVESSFEDRYVKQSKFYNLKF